MRLRTLTVVLLLVSLYLVITQAGQLFITDTAQPHNVFIALLLGCLISAAATIAFDLDIPT